MSQKPWCERFEDTCLLTGNVAKVKVLSKLQEAIENSFGIDVLDIGCVGPQPLAFGSLF